MSTSFNLPKLKPAKISTYQMVPTEIVPKINAYQIYIDQNSNKIQKEVIQKSLKNNLQKKCRSAYYSVLRSH